MNDKDKLALMAASIAGGLASAAMLSRHGDKWKIEEMAQVPRASIEMAEAILMRVNLK